MTEVEEYLNRQKYLVKSDFPKVFRMDYRTFENYYVTASKVNDKRISKAKIEIINIPLNKRTRQLFKTTDVVEFLSFYGISPVKEFKKAVVDATA